MASPVIVTCAHSRIGYAVAQSLAAVSPVIAVGRFHPTMCGSLSGVRAQYRSPDPFADPQGYISVLLEAAQRHGADTLFPVHEEIYPIAANRDVLESQGIKVCCPPIDQLLKLHDKGSVPELAARATVRIPKTVVVESGTSVDELVKQLGSRFIVKPRWGSGALGLRRILRPEDLNELRTEWGIRNPGGDCVVQELVPGCGAGVGVLMRDGTVVACAGHLRIREIPINGGTSTARITLKHQGMLTAAADLVKASGLKDGICMVEFKYERETDEFWAIEINPRYWGGISTAILSGVNFPLLHFSGGASLPLHMPEAAVESRWLLGEARVLFELIRLQRWRDAAKVFRVTPLHAMHWEDFGRGRIGAFFSQVAGYLRSSILYGNFAQHSEARERFFKQLNKG